METEIPDVKIIEPKVWGDRRGFFMESFNQKIFAEKTGFQGTFVQDNHSRSKRGVLRGLHYQIHNPQGRLVRVVAGEVFDVAVDIRKHSPTFGKATSIILTGENKRMFWIPEGFAHGFLVLSDFADFLYKTTAFYDPLSERCIKWNDPDLQIPWPKISGAPILSEKDEKGKWFREAEVFS